MALMTNPIFSQGKSSARPGYVFVRDSIIGTETIEDSRLLWIDVPWRNFVFKRVQVASIVRRNLLGLPFTGNRLESDPLEPDPFVLKNVSNRVCLPRNRCLDRVCLNINEWRKCRYDTWIIHWRKKKKDSCTNVSEGIRWETDRHIYFFAYLFQIAY